MKTIRPAKRSVSPFASPADIGAGLDLRDPVDRALETLQTELTQAGFDTAGKPPATLKTPDDFKFLPALMKKIALAPANDAPELADLCRFLLLFQGKIEEKKLIGPVHEAMSYLFERKTEIFLIDHHTKEQLEKRTAPATGDPGLETHRDVVLFSKERDILVGCYFAPASETQPGRFSEFVNHWLESDNADRLLHFLDFCAGSKNPTFEHYLLFTHPALSRVVRDKGFLKSLFEKTQPLLKKLNSPSWEKDVRTALGV